MSDAPYRVTQSTIGNWFVIRKHPFHVTDIYPGNMRVQALNTAHDRATQEHMEATA